METIKICLEALKSRSPFLSFLDTHWDGFKFLSRTPDLTWHHPAWLKIAEEQVQVVKVERRQGSAPEVSLGFHVNFPHDLCEG